MAAGWPAPRGCRRIDPARGVTVWGHTLTSRPGDSYGSELEKWCVLQLRGMVSWAAEARTQLEISTRSFAMALGFSLSTLTAIENGSVWPRMWNLELVHAAFGSQLTYSGSTSWLGELLHVIDGMDLGMVAAVAGVRRQTIYDLRQVRTGRQRATLRPLSTKTVLQLSGAARLVGQDRDSAFDPRWGRTQVKDPIPLVVDAIERQRRERA